MERNRGGEAVVQAMAIATNEDRSGTRIEPTRAGPNLGRPTLRQPIFDWSSTDKYTELMNFRLEVNNTLLS